VHDDRPRLPPPDTSGLFSVKVDNFGYETRPDELRAIFAKFGEIGDVHTPFDRATGRCRGFGFVRFTKKEDAEEACAKMDGFRCCSSHNFSKHVIIDPAALTAAKSVLFSRGIRDPWMSEPLQAQPQVDLLPGAEAAHLVAIDVALVPMKENKLKYSSQPDLPLNVLFSFVYVCY
jgi:RNA recognition motif-containing protein